MSASGKIVVGVLALPIALAVGYYFAQREPDKPQFYRDVEKNMEGDVWGFPIVEPHYLMTTLSTPLLRETRWMFSTKNGFNNFSPDSISYHRNLILFHDQRKNQYGFYDLRLDKIIFLDSIQQFHDFTQVKGISGELYEVEAVYKCWHETGQLPWGKEIFMQNYSSKTRN